MRRLIRNVARSVVRGTPRPPRTDPRDVFVVSYPRSGSTWVRFLLANLTRGDDEPVNFRTLGRYVPDLHIADQWDIIRATDPPRLLKTHDLPKRRFRRVIYVLRDGRDVAVSHYLYLCGLGRFDGSFEQFLAADKVGPAQWAEHVRAWLDARGRRDLLTVRYEDLLADTAGELRRMADFAGLTCETDRLTDAVEQSSFATMRKLQDTSGRPYDNAEGLEHVRRGTAGQWRAWFDQSLLRLFDSRVGEVMRTVGYADHVES